MKKKPKDENEIAFDIVSRATKPNVHPAVSEAARALSKLGASKGGKARAKKLSGKKRADIAKKAANARWVKYYEER